VRFVNRVLKVGSTLPGSHPAQDLNYQITRKTTFAGRFNHED
jgi:hypothetical protein